MRQGIGAPALPSGSRPSDQAALRPDASRFDPSRGDFLSHLRVVNLARLSAWEGETKADPLFHATELGGEVGEVLNVAKKLHREAMGWRGSRACVADLADEIGDVLICLDKLAAQYGIDLASATAAKFNSTSDKVGLPQKLIDPSWLCGACGASQGAPSPLCSPPFAVVPHRFDGSHPADRRRAAIADTHPEGGDAKQAPFMSGGGADRQSPTLPTHPQTTD